MRSKKIGLIISQVAPGLARLPFSVYPKNRKDPLFYIQKTYGFLNIKK